MSGDLAVEIGSVVLEARGVGRTFAGTDGGIVVLEGVDLAVKRAEVIGVVGASGVSGAGSAGGGGTVASAGRRISSPGRMTVSPVARFSFMTALGDTPAASAMPNHESPAPAV